jgi:hypothetical protein
VKSLIKLVAFAGFMFGISAAGSWWMAARPPHSSEASGETASEAAASEPAMHDITGELPVAVRPKIISPEELLRNAMTLRSREAALQQQEQAAQERQARLELMQADIQGEQIEVDGLNSQVKAQIEAANALLVRITEERAAMEGQRKEFEDTQTKMDASEAQNIKRMSAWIQGMEAETAADFLRELANDGKMDIAVQILSNFEEREASKVLGAIGDSTLMIELAEKFRTLQHPEKPTTRR